MQEQQPLPTLRPLTLAEARRNIFLWSGVSLLMIAALVTTTIQPLYWLWLFLGPARVILEFLTYCRLRRGETVLVPRGNVFVQQAVLVFWAFAAILTPLFLLGAAVAALVFFGKWQGAGGGVAELIWSVALALTSALLVRLNRFVWKKLRPPSTENTERRDQAEPSHWWIRADTRTEVKRGK